MTTASRREYRADSPAVLLYTFLAGQAERAGYNVTVWPADEPMSAPVEIDRDARTIAVSSVAAEVEVIAALAAELAALTDCDQGKRPRGCGDQGPAHS